MIGAIAGDVIGSVYERRQIKTKEFPLFHPHCRFTDDTVLTVAIAHAVLTQTPYLNSLRKHGRQYPRAGYGGMFIDWLHDPAPAPYNSWGNGAAMRVSPIGFAFDKPDEVLDHAEQAAIVTHNHPEGVKGSQATALAVFLARKGATKQEIKNEISKRFQYDLNRRLDEIRPLYSFDVSCQGTVPEAILCFTESQSYEDAVRNAVSLGGDSDTLACITGGIAEAYYGSVPDHILQTVATLLPAPLWAVAEEFHKRYRAPIPQ